MAIGYVMSKGSPPVGTTSGLDLLTLGGTAKPPYDIKYNAPTWDEKAIDALTQKRASTGLSALRRQMQALQGKAFNSDSPQARRMALRDAMRGYGEGVDQVMGGASQTAANEYGRKYGYDVDAAKTQFGANLDALKTGFLTAYDKWKTEKNLSAQKDIAELRGDKYSPVDNPLVKNSLEESLYRGYNKQNW